MQKKKKLIIILAQMKTKTDQISGKQEEGRLGANFQEILYKMKVSDMSWNRPYKIYKCFSE